MDNYNRNDVQRILEKLQKYYGEYGIRKEPLNNVKNSVIDDLMIDLGISRNVVRYVIVIFERITTYSESYGRQLLINIKPVSFDGKVGLDLVMSGLANPDNNFANFSNLDQLEENVFYEMMSRFLTSGSPRVAEEWIARYNNLTHNRNNPLFADSMLKFKHASYSIWKNYPNRALEAINNYNLAISFSYQILEPVFNNPNKRYRWI